MHVNLVFFIFTISYTNPQWQQLIDNLEKQHLVTEN